MCATASLGLSMLWDSDVGVSQVDKYSYSAEEHIKVGQAAARGFSERVLILGVAGWCPPCHRHTARRCPRRARYRVRPPRGARGQQERAAQGRCHQRYRPRVCWLVPPGYCRQAAAVRVGRHRLDGGGLDGCARARLRLCRIRERRHCRHDCAVPDGARGKGAV